MSSIGQSPPTSHHFGRYGLGDTQKYADQSITSIAQLRLARVIAMKISKGLEFPAVALLGVGTCLGWVGLQHSDESYEMLAYCESRNGALLKRFY
jgi:hypothetical protein